MNHREYFNELAPNWDSNLLTEEKIKPLFELLSLNKYETILDGGTGIGNLLPFLLKRLDNGSTVIAIDFASEMTKRAKKRFSSENVTFITADVCYLPFENGYFTTLLYFGLFPHIIGKTDALREAKRVLIPGGKIVIAHPMSRDEMNKFHGSLNGIVRHDILPDDEEMYSLFNSLQYQDVKIIDRASFYYLQAFK